MLVVPLPVRRLVIHVGCEEARRLVVVACGAWAAVSRGDQQEQEKGLTRRGGQGKLARQRSTPQHDALP